MAAVVECSSDTVLYFHGEFICVSFLEGSSAMSLLFLPKMKGVTAITFSLNLEQRTSLYQVNILFHEDKKHFIGENSLMFSINFLQGGGKKVDIVNLLNLPENEVVQAVLIFCGTAVNQRCTSILVGKLQERLVEEFSF